VSDPIQELYELIWDYEDTKSKDPHFDGKTVKETMIEDITVLMAKIMVKKERSGTW